MFHPFNLIYSHLQCTSIHAHVLTWFNFIFMHQSLNIDPELYLNIHSGNLKNVLGQKDKQSCMHAFLQAVTAVKFPRKYSRQRDVTIITSTHVVINYHYHNNLTRRLEEKWITDLVMILKCPKVSCTRYCIIFYGELYYYLHFERSDNFLYEN